jgi:hypothetical protein
MQPAQHRHAVSKLSAILLDVKGWLGGGGTESIMLTMTDRWGAKFISLVSQGLTNYHLQT